MTDLDEMEREAARALLRWLDEHPRVALPDGTPMVWTNGRPIALDVLAVLAALRKLEERL